MNLASRCITEPRLCRQVVLHWFDSTRFTSSPSSRAFFRLQHSLVQGLTIIWPFHAMLGLLSSKAQGCNAYSKPSKLFHLGIHWWVSNCKGFSKFLWFLHNFVLAKVATRSIRAKDLCLRHALVRRSHIVLFLDEHRKTISFCSSMRNIERPSCQVRSCVW